MSTFSDRAKRIFDIGDRPLKKRPKPLRTNLEPMTEEEKMARTLATKRRLDAYLPKQAQSKISTNK